MVVGKDDPIPDVPPPSYDCAINGAKDDRVTEPTEDSAMITPVRIEPEAEPVVDEAALRVKALKVWFLACIPAIAIIGYAFDYGNQINMQLIGPFFLILFVLPLNWLRKPGQRWILLKLAERIPYIRDN